MKHIVEGLTRNSPLRDELVRFLAAFENEERDEAFWRQRLAFWWDENPFSQPESLCGWILQHDGKIFGFLGVIPFDYLHGNQTHKAYAATTWRVAQAHRNASLPLFLQWHRLRERFILLDTTPNAETRRVLERFQYSSAKQLQNLFLPFGSSGERGGKGMALGGFSWWNQLALPRAYGRIVSLGDTFQVRQPETGSLQKKISRAYLDWYCRAPGAPCEFIGCVDGEGTLTSYLILQPDHYGERKVLSVIDHFTVQPDGSELAGLVRQVLRHPERLLLRSDSGFLMLNFLDEPSFLGRLAATICRNNPAKHYYSLPPQLAHAPKRCVVAEGDYGC